VTGWAASQRRRVLVAVAIGVGVLMAPAATAAAAIVSPRGATVSAITEFSRACPGQNAEVEQAADPARGYVYEEWMGCNYHIGFATPLMAGYGSGPPSYSRAPWGPGIRRSR
jgi:hypothetical protein